MYKICASTRGKAQHGSHNYAIMERHYKHLKLIEEKENISIPLNLHNPFRQKNNNQPITPE